MESILSALNALGAIPSGIEPSVALIYPPVVASAVDIVYGSGSTISRMAHAKLGHGGDLEACPLCHRFAWSPDADPGALVTGPGWRVVGSEAVRRLLVP